MRCSRCQVLYGSEVLVCPMDGTPLGEGVLEGRYRLGRKLGEGGMGVVYLAEHIALQKLMAVKVLREELAREPSQARRFELEAIAASRIGHESIVNVTDFGRTASGALYFVMEYLEGETLWLLLRSARGVELPRALNVLLQIGSALEAAHACGIIHRDLKPQNVMLVRRADGSEVAKLLDFGVSKMSTERLERLTEQGALLGTLEYMSPEQANGGEVDARTDIYAFGVMAYEVLTGTLPFQSQSTFKLLMMQVNDLPDPPSHRKPGIPQALEELILHALAKRPEERPQTMAEVNARLRSLRDQLLQPTANASLRSAAALPAPSPEPTRPQAPASEALSSEALSSEALSSEELASVRGSRRRSLAMGLGAVALVVALGATWRVSSEREPRAAAATPPPAAVATPAAAAPAPTPRVSVRSLPPGAAVHRGEQRLGTTPLEVEAPAGELSLTLEGYEPQRVRVPAGQSSIEVKLSQSPRPPPPATERRPYTKVNDLKSSPY